MTPQFASRAFDLACQELNDAGQPDVVHEVMIHRPKVT
jgi:hypothetical protein